jgi:hypothetical protein
MNTPRRGTMLMTAACLAWLGGCARDDGPKLVPVSGTVLVNGQPMPSAHVTFLPTGETRGTGADGKTDASGVFTLKARHRGPGAVAGTYKVVVSKMVKADGSDITPEDATPPVLSGAREVIPGPYSSHAASTLTATVPEEGTGDLRIEIKTTSRR